MGLAGLLKAPIQPELIDLSFRRHICTHFRNIEHRLYTSLVYFVCLKVSFCQYWTSRSGIRIRVHFHFVSTAERIDRRLQAVHFPT